jgi:hypothetical protein
VKMTEPIARFSANVKFGALVITAAARINTEVMHTSEWRARSTCITWNVVYVRHGNRHHVRGVQRWANGSRIDDANSDVVGPR